MAEIILLEFCGEPLALTREQLDDARLRARELLPAPKAAQAPTAEQMVDASILAKMTSLPQSWIEEQARRGRLPSLQLGKYRRYQVDETIEAMRMLGRAP